VSTPLTIDEIRQQHGEKSVRRQFLFARCQTVLRLLLETGQLRRLYLFGSERPLSLLLAILIVWQ
jgi:hypothetical protein